MEGGVIGEDHKHAKRSILGFCHIEYVVGWTDLDPVRIKLEEKRWEVQAR